ncbi:replication initiation factor domain-containing protein [Ruminiclostridium hungatei]|nr:replication initiation factor domain-containing protein [Ruminiclostridium hungatei]
MIDWLEFSVFGMTEIDVLKLMGINELIFDVKRGFYYERVLSYENIVQVSSGLKGNDSDKHEHIHVRLTGKGCRLLEQFYGTDDIRTEIRCRFILNEIKVSRMDIAVDYSMKFVIDYFHSALNKRLNGVKSIDHAGNFVSGLTLYLGSRKSEKFFRLYEKDFETGDFVNYKDRLELVLKNEYATFEMLNENLLIKIVSTYMNDIVWLEDDRRMLWSEMKNGQCEISPKIRHKKTTLKEKRDYILNTYGKTLKASAEMYGTKEITSAIHESVYSERDLRMIKNEKVINVMKYKKEAKKRDLSQRKVIDELKYHKGIWLDRPVYENGEIVRYEKQFVQQLEPDRDKLNQLSILAELNSEVG